MERAAGEIDRSGRAQGIEAVTAVDRFAASKSPAATCTMSSPSPPSILSAPSPPMMMSA